MQFRPDKCMLTYYVQLYISHTITSSMHLYELYKAQNNCYAFIWRLSRGCLWVLPTFQIKKWQLSKLLIIIKQLSILYVLHWKMQIISLSFKKLIIVSFPRFVFFFTALFPIFAYIVRWAKFFMVLEFFSIWFVRVYCKIWSEVD